MCICMYMIQNIIMKYKLHAKYMYFLLCITPHNNWSLSTPLRLRWHLHAAAPHFEGQTRSLRAQSRIVTSRHSVTVPCFFRFPVPLHARSGQLTLLWTIRSPSSLAARRAVLALPCQYPLVSIPHVTGGHLADTTSFSCENLAARSYIVYATSRSLTSMDDLRHPNIRKYVCDVTNDQQVESVVSKIMA